MAKKCMYSGLEKLVLKYIMLRKPISIMLKNKFTSSYLVITRKLICFSDGFLILIYVPCCISLRRDVLVLKMFHYVNNHHIIILICSLNQFKLINSI